MDKKPAYGGLASGLAGTGLQLSDWHNPYVAGICFVLAAILGIYSIRDWLNFLPWSPMLPLPIASRKALEAIEGSVLSVAARRQGMAPNGALCHIATRLVMDDMPVYGKHVPSSQLELIPANSVLFADQFAQDAAVLEDKSTHQVRYTDLKVRRRDLKSAIAKLKAKHPVSEG